MKFFIEVAPPTVGAEVQWVGSLGDGTFVVEAETREDAEAKLFDLLTMTIVSVETRPATDNEVQEFTERRAAEMTGALTKNSAGLHEQAS